MTHLDQENKLLTFFSEITSRTIVPLLKLSRNRLLIKINTWWRELMLLKLKHLFYLAGMFHSNLQNLRDLWQTDWTGVDIFYNMMSINRFEFLMSVFGLVTSRIANGKDQVALDTWISGIIWRKIKAVLYCFVLCDNRSEVVVPANSTCHTSLLSMGSRCKHYLTSVPTAFWPSKKTYRGAYSLSNSPLDFVERLIQPISGSNRNVTFDNW